MFDIGFAELLLVAVVGLLVLGPERLPEAIRTGAAWLNRLRRGFNDIKREIQQELHNDAIMRELRDTGRQLKQDNAPSEAAADTRPPKPSQAPADTPAAMPQDAHPDRGPGNPPPASPAPPDDGSRPADRDPE